MIVRAFPWLVVRVRAQQMSNTAVGGVVASSSSSSSGSSDTSVPQPPVTFSEFLNAGTKYLDVDEASDDEGDDAYGYVSDPEGDDIIKHALDDNGRL